MVIRFRAVAVAAVLTVVGLVALDQTTGAQEPAASKPTDPPVKKKQDPARRVPPYFGQIGLTPEQKATIYGIQGKRQEKIEALEKQIAIEKAEMLAQCEGTLTEIQKKLLDNLRHASTESASTKTADTSKPSK